MWVCRACFVLCLTTTWSAVPPTCCAVLHPQALLDFDDDGYVTMADLVAAEAGATRVAAEVAKGGASGMARLVPVAALELHGPSKVGWEGVGGGRSAGVWWGLGRYHRGALCLCGGGEGGGAWLWL